MGFTDRLQHAWNAFLNKDPPKSTYSYGLGSIGSYRPDRRRYTRGKERSIIASIYTRIAIDAAAITVEHARLDDDDRFLYAMDSGLNECLTVSANSDQTGRAFMQDVVMSLCDEGCVAIVPTDTTSSLRQTNSNSFDVLSMRVGRITEWYPQHVKINVYNEKTGLREDIVLPKKSVAIVENPLYAVMNEQNSTIQRLTRKLALLDEIDEQSGAGKLDMIIQLPYVVKSEARRQQAEQRRKDIEMQLAGSKYGIAYTDGTEKVVQLNRSLENNLMAQIEYLTNMVYSQLGMTPEVFSGTANETTMLNYYNRTIEPIMSAITDEMIRKFLTKTARTQKQSIVFFREPFKLVPVEQMASIADSFTRNEILTSNEIRQILGYKPSDTPDADILRNKNLNASDQELGLYDTGQYEQPVEEEYSEGGY